MDSKRVAKRTRWYRKLHRIIASFTFIFFLFISVTGILLGWKKHSGGYLLAKSHKGTTTDISQWLSLDSLQKTAIKVLHDSVSPRLSGKLDRIDARPDKGMIKFVFADHFWAVQLDAATAKVLHVEKRRADFIENLHDGSYFDKLTGDGNQSVKLTYTTITGLSLLMLTLSGFWLWYNPKRLKNRNKE